MSNELVVIEHPVVAKEQNRGYQKDEEKENIIDVKAKVTRESHFDKDKAKRIPKHARRLVKAVGKTIWGYTIGHESNEAGAASGNSQRSANRDQRTFHPDDIVARRPTQVTDNDNNPFWSSNLNSRNGSPFNQTIGRSFDWRLQSSNERKAPSRYSKKYKGGKSWKKKQ